MGVVDTLMAGQAGRLMLGAVALGHGLYYTLAVFGLGMLLGLDALVSQAFGRGDRDECRRWLAAGIVTSFLLGPPITVLAWCMDPVMQFTGIDTELRSETMRYLRAISWGSLPLMLYAAFRRYLQSQNLANPVMFALVSANIVNAFVNWVLIFGNLGFPALGAEGAGYATSFSRCYMAGVLIFVTWLRDQWTGWTAWPGWARVKEVCRLGLPAALQISLEVAVFAFTTTMMGKLGAVALGGHQIALNVASVTYMVPLGISSAAAVRVGQAIGRGDLSAARRAGWVATALGAIFMLAAGVVLWVVPQWIARAYTPDAEVVATAVALLGIAAWFQLFDGIQAVATGALRGLGDTKTAMYTHVSIYWGIGLPLGYWLTFTHGWGPAGFWVGLCVSLILIGVVLLAAWHRESRYPANIRA